jgi:hypothetical protein
MDIKLDNKGKAVVSSALHGSYELITKMLQDKVKLRLTLNDCSLLCSLAADILDAVNIIEK